MRPEKLIPQASQEQSIDLTSGSSHAAATAGLPEACAGKPTIYRRVQRYTAFWGCTLVFLLLDQWTKHWIQFQSGYPHGVYPPYGGHEIIPGFLSIVFTTNEGAAWGMFSGFSIMLSLLALGALSAIYGFRRQLELRRPIMQIAFGLMVSGIVGNLMDRLRFSYVVDFIDVHLGFYRWPTFNVADSAIFCGVILYLIWSIKYDLTGARTESRNS